MHALPALAALLPIVAQGADAYPAVRSLPPWLWKHDKGDQSDWSKNGKNNNYTFETVTGFFAQDLDSTNASTFDFLASNFGLVSTAPYAWEAFDWSIQKLNKEAEKGVSYKVLYLARHGEGYHNVAEVKYGTQAWDDYWSLIYTDGNITWGPDPLITEKGIAQAQNVSAAWRQKATETGIPLPESFYSSPLTRSSDTLRIEFEQLYKDLGKEFEPVVMEGLRETIGEHTCDMRSNKTFIHNRFPTWDFQHGFTEEDELWTKERESNAARTARVRQALVDIWNNDESTLVSITAHGGTIQSALEAVNHRAFSVSTGGLIPVVVKATKQ